MNSATNRNEWMTAMGFQIIIKGRDASRRRLKGKGVTEYARNLESEGWPSEFRSEEERDRAKFHEKQLGRPLRKLDVKHG